MAELTTFGELPATARPQAALLGQRHPHLAPPSDSLTPPWRLGTYAERDSGADRLQFRIRKLGPLDSANLSEYTAYERMLRSREAG